MEDTLKMGIPQLMEKKEEKQLNFGVPLTKPIPAWTKSTPPRDGPSEASVSSRITWLLQHQT